MTDLLRININGLLAYIPSHFGDITYFLIDIYMYVPVFYYFEGMPFNM